MTSPPSVRSAIRHLPLSVRLGASFASVFLVVLAGLVALAYWGLGVTLRQGLDRALLDAVPQVDGHRALAEVDERELAGIESSEIEIQLLDRSGAVLGTTDDDLTAPLLDATQVRAVLDGVAVFADAQGGGEEQRVLGRILPSDPSRLQVLAVEMDPVVDSQTALLERAAPLAALAGMLAGLIGWHVARRGLAPMAELAAQAGALNARDLSRRLELRRSEDEIARLGQTLNEMLARIEDARRRERQFTADASHELRTPLAILRAEVELARGQVGDDRELGNSLDSALEECDRLGDLVDGLLEVARGDTGLIDRVERVDVAELVDALLPRFAVLARRREVTLIRSGDAAVRADRRALLRALSNLLDNAVRHAPRGGRVELEIRRTGRSVSVSVTDDGPGMPAARRERATQRFAQFDSDRAERGGAGLGLAMVAAIAAAHRGTLELATPASGAGLAATLRLPADGDDEPAP